MFFYLCGVISKKNALFLKIFVCRFANIGEKPYLCTIKITNNRAAQLVKLCTEDMTQKEYKEMSATAEGRKELHGVMLVEVRERMETIKLSSPKENQPKIEVFFAVAYDKIKMMGNSDIYDYFCNGQLSDKCFIDYCAKASSGKI